MEENIEEKPCLFYDPLGWVSKSPSNRSMMLSARNTLLPLINATHDLISIIMLIALMMFFLEVVLVVIMVLVVVLAQAQALILIFWLKTFLDSEFVLQFRIGLEEAYKFVPTCNPLVIKGGHQFGWFG